MSIELPEARIIAEQLDQEVVGARVSGYELRNAARMQEIGFINRDVTAFDMLTDGVIAEVVSRGNTVLVHLDNDSTLLIAPEYGGEVLLHVPGADVAGPFQFRLLLESGASVTVRIKSMGGVVALNPEELVRNYMYLRDFNMAVLDPSADSFTFAAFSAALGGARRAIKSVLVGKDAVLVGLSNATFQDVIFRAGIHPKRRAADLSEEERRMLYEAVTFVVAERMRLGGKVGFNDIHGKPGMYQPAMGPHLKGRPCPQCGGTVEKMPLGGGETWYCRGCQPE